MNTRNAHILATSRQRELLTDAAQLRPISARRRNAMASIRAAFDRMRTADAITYLSFTPGVRGYPY